MIPHIRKLLQINDYHNSHEPNFTFSPLPLLQHNHVTNNPVRQPNAPFDSSMAITILVLLTALFFMGFFSIYIKRFADDSPVDASRRRRQLRPSLSHSQFTSPTGYSARKGADPLTITSLPVFSYGGDTKHKNIDCPICLGEFEDRECVKMIPYCKHVFHQGCIDTWLSSRATCPLCRTTRLFPVEKGCVIVDMNGTKGSTGSDERGLEMTSTVDAGDTLTSSMRRTSSSSILSCERVALQRTASF